MKTFRVNVDPGKEERIKKYTAQLQGEHNSDPLNFYHLLLSVISLENYLFGVKFVDKARTEIESIKVDNGPLKDVISFSVLEDLLWEIDKTNE